MTGAKPAYGRSVTGAAGVLLIVSLFLPWTAGGGMEWTGFELLSTLDVFLLIVGLLAIVTALTWRRYGLFRPDLSMNGATDLLSLVATILLTWLILFDFPAGADPGVGAFLALGAAIAISAGTGDYSPLRGAPWFPRTGSETRRK